MRKYDTPPAIEAWVIPAENANMNIMEKVERLQNIGDGLLEIKRMRDDSFAVYSEISYVAVSLSEYIESEYPSLESRVMKPEEI